MKVKNNVLDPLNGAGGCGYLDIHIHIFQIFGPYTATLKARKLKLDVDDSLKGANV